MWWPFHGSRRYQSVATDDDEQKQTSIDIQDTDPRRPSQRTRVFGVWVVVIILFSAVGALIYSVWQPAIRAPPSQVGDWTYYNILPDDHPTEELPSSSRPAEEPVAKETPSSDVTQNFSDQDSGEEISDSHPLIESTRNCSLRREWRTLSSAEQQHYIDSVRCLLTTPSIRSPNSTRYADYPWIHSHVGYYTHHSAAFLPWHRYFLHIYESTLRQECNFTGALVYWDWTLDANDLAHSPVFSATSGFGSDGEEGGEITVGNSGRCVVDGPFADIQAEYYDTKLMPHCLSRGFHDDAGNLGRMDGSDITPVSIEGALEVDDYEAFVALLESKVHDAIPFGIGGDFETFTAPYDPLFFLHHTQLDRIWWLWQQRDPGNRLTAYGGHNHRHSMEQAKLDDEIQMQGFAPAVKVRDVMNIEGDLLCYKY